MILSMSSRDAMTDDELDAAERRALAATPGPWQSLVEGREHDSGDSFIRTGGTGLYTDLYIEYGGWAPEDWRRDDEQRRLFEQRRADDMDFIAAARQDVPRLLAEVRRLRGLLADEGEI